MATYSFKSAGRTSDTRANEATVSSPIPIGIKTPLELGQPGEFFKMHTDLAANTHDNLKNLIMTNWGERLGRYDLGANLRPLLADWSTQDDFDAQAVGRISSAVSRWMPYVSLDDFTSLTYGQKGSAQYVRITITYNVPAIDALNKKLEVTLRIM